MAKIGDTEAKWLTRFPGTRLILRDTLNGHKRMAVQFPDGGQVVGLFVNNSCEVQTSLTPYTKSREPSPADVEKVAGQYGGHLDSWAFLSPNENYKQWVRPDRQLEIVLQKGPDGRWSLSTIAGSMLAEMTGNSSANDAPNSAPVPDRGLQPTLDTPKLATMAEPTSTPIPKPTVAPIAAGDISSVSTAVAQSPPGASVRSTSAGKDRDQPSDDTNIAVATGDKLVQPSGKHSSLISNMLAGIIVGVLAVIIVVVVSVFKLNRYCAEKYEYRPFSIGKAFLMLAALVLAIVGIVWAAFIVPQDSHMHFDLNAIIFLTASAVLAFFVFVRISGETNILIGAYASLVLLLGCVFVVALMFLDVAGKSSPTIRG